MVVTNGTISAPLSPEALLQGLHTPMMVDIRFNDNLVMQQQKGLSTSSVYGCTTAADNTPSPVLQLLRRANSFLIQGLRASDGSSCLPLMTAGRQVGILRREVVRLLARFPDTFLVTSTAVFLNPKLTTYADRTAAVACALESIRATGETVALRSWRGENFVVWGRYGSEPLFEVERAAVALLGIRAFGVHITGFVRSPAGAVEAVWLQKRSETKPTYPGMMDTMVGGGLTAGLKPSEVLYKEADEEASIPAQLVDRAQAVGTVSFFTETERGIHANTEYVYEIELPRGFEPSISDGEVEGFALISIAEIMDYLLNPNFKLTSTPILIDFLIRHGIITSDTVPDLPEITEMLHAPLNHLYNFWPSFPPPAPPSSLAYPENSATTTSHVAAAGATTDVTASVLYSDDEVGDSSMLSAGTSSCSEAAHVVVPVLNGIVADRRVNYLRATSESSSVGGSTTDYTSEDSEDGLCSC